MNKFKNIMVQREIPRNLSKPEIYEWLKLRGFHLVQYEKQNNEKHDLQKNRCSDIHTPVPFLQPGRQPVYQKSNHDQDQHIAVSINDIGDQVKPEIIQDLPEHDGGCMQRFCAKNQP